MQGPINPIDTERFKKLTDLIAAKGEGDMKIYVSEGFVSIELTARHVDMNAVNEILGVPIREQSAA